MKINWTKISTYRDKKKVVKYFPSPTYPLFEVYPTKAVPFFFLFNCNAINGVVNFHTSVYWKIIESKHTKASIILSLFSNYLEAIIIFLSPPGILKTTIYVIVWIELLVDPCRLILSTSKKKLISLKKKILIGSRSSTQPSYRS